MDTNFIHFAVQQMVPIPGTYIQQLSISDNENIYTILLSFTTIILNLVKYVIGKCKLLFHASIVLNIYIYSDLSYQTQTYSLNTFLKCTLNF